MFQPVFYSYTDYDFGAPQPIRVLFPTLDFEGFPLNIYKPSHPANILEDCGRFPLVVFIHGNCPSQDPDHYLKWTWMLSYLARAGFVVAIPQLKSFNTHYDTTAPEILEELLGVIGWMLFEWKYSYLLSTPIGLIGHSRGGVAVANVAAKLGYSSLVGAQALLSPWFYDQAYKAADPAELVKQFHSPSLIMFGNSKVGGEVGSTAPVKPNEPLYWESFSEPKTLVRFPSGGHWDYLSVFPSGCSYDNPARCGAQWKLTSEMLIKFFARSLQKSSIVNIDNSPIPPTNYWLQVINDDLAGLLTPSQLGAKDLDDHDMRQVFLADYMQGLTKFQEGCDAFWRNVTQGVTTEGWV